MKITVHRGSNQIGGCVTEYESNGWKLFVDYGEQLPGTPTSEKKVGDRWTDLWRYKKKCPVNHALSRRSYWQNHRTTTRASHIYGQDG